MWQAFKKVSDCFLVERRDGPAYDRSRPRREQDGWAEHAAFMDGLAEEGFVVLGGPIGEGEGEGAMLVVRAPDEQAIRRRLAQDPWHETVLHAPSVRPWSVLLGELPGP